MHTKTSSPLAPPLRSRSPKTSEITRKSSMSHMIHTKNQRKSRTR